MKSDNILAVRLKQFRLARGLSLEGLAALMGGAVTKQALSKFETGNAKPSLKTLNHIASVFGVKSVALWAQPEIEVNFIGYRALSSLPKKEMDTVESSVNLILEDRIRIQELTGYTSLAKLPVMRFKAADFDDVEKCATGLRDEWKLGLAPITSVTNALENNLVHVIEIEAPQKFDGLSAVAKDEKGKVIAAAVVTKKGVSGERQRFNLAHELGHLVLKISGDLDEEKAAHRFGAAFLVPADTLISDVGNKRKSIMLPELLMLKRRFGVSIQSLIYRMRELAIITDAHYTQWCKKINWLGWRKEEKHPIAPEKPQWLRQNVFRALAEGALSAGEAQRMLGETIDVEVPQSLVQKRAFLKLPMGERRKILERQAEKLASHYENDNEWREIEGGDIVEY